MAVAEGATGILFYAAVPSAPGERQLWEAGWTETVNTRAAGELFERLSRVAPVLCRLEREVALALAQEMRLPQADTIAGLLESAEDD